MNSSIIKQNVVPSNSPRKVVLSTGILYRFGFEDLGSGFSKCGEILVNPKVADASSIVKLVREYCKENSIEETVSIKDYR